MWQQLGHGKRIVLVDSAGQSDLLNGSTGAQLWADAQAYWASAFTEQKKRLGPADKQFFVIVSTVIPIGPAWGWTGAMEAARVAYNNLLRDHDGARLSGVAAMPALIASPWAGFGNAAEFDGVNRLSGTQGVCLGCDDTGVTGQFTIEAKFRPYAAPALASMIASRTRSNDAGERQYQLWLTSDRRLRGRLMDNAGVDHILESAAASVALNANHDAALTFDGGAARLFLDGALVETEASAPPEAPSPDVPLLIGRNSESVAASDTPYPFQGVIDSVRLSDVARYTLPYVPAAAPFVDDAHTVVLERFDEIVTDSCDEFTLSVVDVDAMQVWNPLNLAHYSDQIHPADAATGIGLFVAGYADAIAALPHP